MALKVSACVTLCPLNWPKQVIYKPGINGTKKCVPPTKNSPSHTVIVWMHDPLEGGERGIFKESIFKETT